MLKQLKKKGTCTFALKDFIAERKKKKGTKVERKHPGILVESPYQLDHPRILNPSSPPPKVSPTARLPSPRPPQLAGHVESPDRILQIR